MIKIDAITHTTARKKAEAILKRRFAGFKVEVMDDLMKDPFVTGDTDTESVKKSLNLILNRLENIIFKNPKKD